MSVIGIIFRILALSGDGLVVMVVFLFYIYILYFDSAKNGHGPLNYIDLSSSLLDKLPISILKYANEKPEV